MSFNVKHTLLLLPLALAACTTMPSGPSVMVLPGSGKSMEQFQADDLYCRQYASSINGTNSEDLAVRNGVTSAVVGTAIGAAAGALLDGGHGHGAAAGAGAGLLIGGASGVGAANQTAYQAQQRYDNAYQQCMYAKGNRIPVSGNMVQESSYGNQQYNSGRRGQSAPPPNMQTPPPSQYVVPNNY